MGYNGRDKRMDPGGSNFNQQYKDYITRRRQMLDFLMNPKVLNKMEGTRYEVYVFNMPGGQTYVNLN